MSLGRSPVGLFGYGLIGACLAERLGAAGFDVRVHDPDEERMTAARTAGFVTQPHPRRLAEECPRLILAVFDVAQAEAVLRDLSPHTPAAGIRAIVVSTCDPDRLARLGAEVAAKGIDLVEAPISGSSGELAAGAATLLVAGAPDAIGACEDLLSAVSPRIIRLGTLGEGNRAKLAVNLVLGLNRAALAEGLVFAAALGLDPAAFLSILRTSAAFSQVMAVKGDSMVVRDFTPRGRLRQSAKDFDLIANCATSQDLRLPLGELYRELVADNLGHAEGELDNCAIILAIERAGRRRLDVPSRTA